VSGSPVLEAVGVGYRYTPAGPDVLCDISLTLHAGEVLGVVGPNGAGKSTLLRILAGLVAPSSGDVRVSGERVGDVPRSLLARRVAYVPQRERVPAGLRVEEVVSLGRAPHTGWFGVLSSRDRDAVREAMRRCEVEVHARRPIETLSGGEQKRCFMARALAQETSALILDEPVAHLDVEHQFALCDLLVRGARERSLAVLVVLHDLNLAAQYCDRLLVLERARAARPEPVRDVIEPGRIREVFHVDCVTGTRPDGGGAWVVPVRILPPR
jgi:iron complex transport system ATP-binding protein